MVDYLPLLALALSSFLTRFDRAGPIRWVGVCLLGLACFVNYRAMIQFDHQRGEFEVVAGRRVKLVPVERTARKEVTPFEDPTDALADWVIDQARTAGTLDH